MSNKTLMTYLETFCLEIKNKLLKQQYGNNKNEN